jgi:GDSL-like lipase/acylhydrolase family protein
MVGTRDGGFARRGRSFGWPALALTLAVLLVAAAAVAAGAAVVTGRSGSDGGHPAAPRIADLGGTLTQPAAQDGGDRLVVLFGDSFSESALPATSDRFLTDPRLRLSPNVYGGTTLDTQTWRDGYPGVGDGSIVMLLLGTNDISTDTITKTEDDARAAIEALSSAGAERVVVATINTTGRPPGQDASWTDRARAFNDWLRQADRDPLDYPTLQVVEWADMAWGRTDWLAPDGIHLNPAGQLAYAEMTYAAARAAAGLPASG